MASDSTIRLNVGGQMFQTSIKTLTKYPASMLETMFNHVDDGLMPMPKTKEGYYFLDVDPDYFRLVLNWLRLDVITTEDPGLLKGTQELANYFGLEKLAKIIETIKKVDILPEKKIKSIPDMIWIELNKVPWDGIQIRTAKLIRVPDSLIAKYFRGENCYAPLGKSNICLVLISSCRM